MRLRHLPRYQRSVLFTLPDLDQCFEAFTKGLNSLGLAMPSAQGNALPGRCEVRLRHVGETHGGGVFVPRVGEKFP